MNEIEFKKKYEEDKSIYEAWGIYIQDRIISLLSEKVDIQTFIKINCSPRVKDTNTLIQKAFYRNKNYENAYNDITDKVGVRFVVLLNEDIRLVSKLIEDIEEWVFSKDRDYEKERLIKPEIFTYQSVHYILRNKLSFTYNKVVIPDFTPCEVQIRTLLQHSYSELTHDTIYKGKTKSTPEAHRIIARSMALIEATDELFGEVNNMLHVNDNLFNNTIEQLMKIYSEIIESDYSKELNIFILDAYQEVLKDINFDKIRELLSKKLICDLIKTKYESNLLYRQPIVLLLYYLILNNRTTALKLWPLTEAEIEPLYNDLGLNI